MANPVQNIYNWQYSEKGLRVSSQIDNVVYEKHNGQQYEPVLSYVIGITHTGDYCPYNHVLFAMRGFGIDNFKNIGYQYIESPKQSHVIFKAVELLK